MACARYEMRRQVAVIQLDDETTLNAFSDEMFDSAIDAISRAEKEARALVLTGNGRAFSSGGSIGQMAIDGPAEDRDAGAKVEQRINPLMVRLRELRIPLVTAVNGAAAGLGCAIALAGDLVVASESAYFLQAFSRIGLIPDGGSAFILAASAGRVRAMEMMMLAERIPAGQALDWGLVNRVVPDADLMSVALEIAGRLASGPAESLRVIRDMGWRALEHSFHQQLALERAMQRRVGGLPDFSEGVRAFREKRAPDFGGNPT